ncbi:hypothetical protein BDZ88DRAFT_291833 [Geranomyces variabilis]|nr:hypothetical protein BDZ88DRAFT_291833 [Geranomyces variabilis]KAJ3138544.1 hypothetical protein HDU90_000985 [Geranomyces variabilis]
METIKSAKRKGTTPPAAPVASAKAKERAAGGQNGGVEVEEGNDAEVEKSNDAGGVETMQQEKDRVQAELQQLERQKGAATARKAKETGERNNAAKVAAKAAAKRQRSVSSASERSSSPEPAPDKRRRVQESPGPSSHPITSGVELLDVSPEQRGSDIKAWRRDHLTIDSSDAFLADSTRTGRFLLAMSKSFDEQDGAFIKYRKVFKGQKEVLKDRKLEGESRARGGRKRRSH